jgi:hypothetical protein
MCVALEGKYLGHLVRNNAHRGEKEEELVLPNDSRGLVIHQLKITNAETTVVVEGDVTEIREDRLNSALIWIELQDEDVCPKSKGRRKLAMMAHHADRELFALGTQQILIVEVRAENRQFIGDPEIERTLLKPLRIHLWLVAIRSPDLVIHANRRPDHLS